MSHVQWRQIHFSLLKCMNFTTRTCLQHLDVTFLHLLKLTHHRRSHMELGTLCRCSPRWSWTGSRVCESERWRRLAARRSDTSRRWWWRWEQLEGHMIGYYARERSLLVNSSAVWIRVLSRAWLIYRSDDIICRYWPITDILISANMCYISST